MDIYFSRYEIKRKRNIGKSIINIIDIKLIYISYLPTHLHLFVNSYPFKMRVKNVTRN
jgi:hypothetical protein